MASSLVEGGGSGERRGGGGGGRGEEREGGGACHGGEGVGGSGKRRSGGGVCQMLLRILLLSSCLSNLLIIPASGQRSVQCVQLGQWEETGPYSIGGKNFRVKDRGPMRLTYQGGSCDHCFVGDEKFMKFMKDNNKCNQDVGLNSTAFDWFKQKACPNGLNPKTELKSDLEYCPIDVTIRTYLVKEDKKVLRGWLHFEVEMAAQSRDEEMEYIYAQVRDEAFNAIGEFVWEEKDQCKPSNKQLISPTKYQFLPCSAAGQREAKTSQAIFVAKPTQYVNNPKKHFMTEKELKRGIHFTWRLDEYWCNRHEKFRLE